MNSDDVLRMDNVSKRFRRSGGDAIALEEVRLQVRKGQSVVIRGPSGSGKSTLMLIAAAMLRPSSGHVWLCGQNITSMPMWRASRLRKGDASIILPALELIPYLSALENVCLADTSAKGKRRALDFLESLGLAERVSHLPSQLSTGEQRRVLVARSLLHQPSILFCDEPTANLDSENASLIRNAILKACAEGCAVVTVTHEDAGLFRADTEFSMHRGKLTPADDVSRLPTT
jgi:putative ABC transport system ATP-binding protein